MKLKFSEGGKESWFIRIVTYVHVERLKRNRSHASRQPRNILYALLILLDDSRAMYGAYFGASTWEEEEEEEEKEGRLKVLTRAKRFWRELQGFANKLGQKIN